MPKIPDLKSMSPDRWLSELQTLREEMLEEFTETLAQTAEVAEAAERLDALFEEYALTGDSGEEIPLLSVRAEKGDLVFTHSSEPERELRARPADDEDWQIDPASEGGSAEQAAPEELASRALQLIPWWSEGAFASSVGNPEDFAGPDEE